MNPRALLLLSVVLVYATYLTAEQDAIVLALTALMMTLKKGFTHG